MKIAIDMRALDGASQFRGIGIYLMRISHELIPFLLRNHEVVLYVYEQSNLDAIDKQLVEQCRVITVARPPSSKLPSYIQKVAGGIISREYNRTDSLPELDTIDHFFQPYHELGVPSSVDNTVVCHDLIPLVFTDKYFHRLKITISPVSWLKFLRERAQEKTYMESLAVFKRADKIVSVSEHTKETLVDLLSIDEQKIHVVLHGNETPPKATITKRLKPHIKSPYITYVGGIDYRREIVGLLKAAPTLFADHGIKTLVAGNDFTTTTDPEVLRALEASSHVQAVESFGFVSEGEKQALIENAIAFVYPTYYEGFGLPVLEAFNANTPIITYKNSSLPEVGGDAAIYASDIEDTHKKVVSLLKNTKQTKQRVAAGTKQAKQFSWVKSAKQTSKVITK